MWALLKDDKETVLACFPPDTPYDKMLEEANGRIIIEMTINNSPAYINGKYINGKFYPPEELANG